MKAALLTFTVALWATVQPMPTAAADSSVSHSTAAFRVLVFSKTLGFRHASITNGVQALRELGSQNGFAVDATEESGEFTATNLARYTAVVFLSTTGDVLDADQES